MKKGLYYGLLAVLVAVFLFSAYQIGGYLLEKYRSDRMMDSASKFVTVEQGGAESENATGDPERIAVDFDELRKMNSDVVGWIYCANTKFNYPIVQTGDNEYYLHHLLDGTWNNNGTIFMDYRNSADFSDRNTMIHGHHMKSGAMFGELIQYKKQSFYDEHPYIYIMTEQQNYRLDLLAGCIVDSVSDIYTTELSDEMLYSCMSNSTFTPKVSYQGGRIVTLSTCSYEYDDARYVVMGELVAID